MDYTESIRCRAHCSKGSFRAPGLRHQCPTFIVKDGKAYLFTIQQGIFILHTDKLRPSVLFSDMVELRELPSPHRASSNVPNLPALHEVMERFHCLFRRSLEIIAVDLQDINVRRLETFEGCVNRIEDRLTRQSGVVDIVPGVLKMREHRSKNAGVFVYHTVAFRKNDEFIPRNIVLI